MRWVDQAITRPYRCAVVPFVGNGSGQLFIDTGQDLDLEHVYISQSGAEACAEMLGWVRPEALGSAQHEIARLEGRVEELEAELAAADRFEEAIDGLTKKGMVIRKQPGRKPAKEKVAS